VISTVEQPLTKKDFTPDNEPRWCPGCGDYAILNTIQKVFPELGIPKEKFVVVSGIGCSSRFPYYMSTYGFHTLHGRAPTVATGVKAANPELSVWLVTGDGDGLSIGGNHLMHMMRRNPDIKVLLFNNRIYGLTKGQYSPTSEPGLVTKSSPLGSFEQPINPLALAVASQATFVARTMDNNPKHMTKVFMAAAAHKGTAMIEIFQNCVIFNNNTFEPVYGKENRGQQVLFLEDGQPMTFGDQGELGIVFDGTRPKIVSAQDGTPAIHRENANDSTLAYAMAEMSFPDFPTPMGILRRIERPTFEDSLHQQVRQATQTKGEGDLQSLIRGSDFWEVQADGGRKVQSIADEESFLVIEDDSADKALSKEEQQLAEDPMVKIFNTRLEEILDFFGYSHSFTLQKTESIDQAVTLMKRSGHGSILILDGEKIAGIFTERDILFKVIDLVEDTASTPVSVVMTETPEVVASWNTLGQALLTMSEGGFRHLPVRRAHGRLALISIKGVLAYLHKRAHG